LKQDSDHPKAISFIEGAEAREEFVLCLLTTNISSAECGHPRQL